MWALIQHGIVHEITDIDPEGRFHPDLKWYACGNDACVGWNFIDGEVVPPVYDPSLRVNEERIWRDTEIENVQWLRERHRDESDLERAHTLTPEQFKQLLSYLQALRDWPLSPYFPARDQRPIQPDWIAEQTR